MIWRGMALLMGLVLLGAEVYATYEFTLAMEGGRITYLVVAGCMLIAGSGLAPVLAGLEWRSGRWAAAFVLWACAPLLLAATLWIAVSRTGGGADVARDQRIKAARNERVQQAEVARLERAVERAQEMAKAECALRAGGRGPDCRARELAEIAAGAELSRAREKLLAMPAAPSGGMGIRVESMTHGAIDAETVATYEPVILPLLIAIMASVFLSAGARPHKRPEKQKAKAPKPEPLPVVAPVEIAPPAEIVRPAVAQLPPPRPKVVPMARPKPSNFGSVTDFLVEALQPAEGHSTDIEHMLEAYRRWCAAKSRDPMHPERFFEALESIAPRIGLAMRLEGEALKLPNVRLIA